MIEVSGTVSRDLKAYIQRVAEYLNLDLYDPYYELDIVRKCAQQAGGYCHGDENDIQIEIARYDAGGKVSRDHMKINIAHELIHAQQIASGRLENGGFFVNREGGAETLAYRHVFDGVEYINCPYENQPWEQEAYQREEEVYQACR